MLKKIIFTGLLLCVTFAVSAQSQRELSDREKVTDSSIVYPADMERNYDQLLSTWSKDVKYADDCTNSIDETTIAPDSTYINRLYSLPTKMELVFNPVVRTYIEMYAGRRRNQVSYMLGEGKYYFPMFEEALDKEGIPLELKYLPVIESALNPIARSRVGATGLWQFMAGTGKMYNLEINSLVDERSDPQKSTDAAAKYLKDLYSIYGDWNLVIAAYNCGPGNVNKAIRRSGGLTDYWAIYPYLPKETRGYVPAFIAATYIMNYYGEHNICPVECSNPASLDTLVIDKTVHFQQIADIIDIPVEDIRKYNPQFKSDVVPGNYKGYAINLPIKKIGAFIDNKDTIYAHRSAELLTHRKVAGIDAVSGIKGASGSVTHRVKKGDTLSKIASSYGVTLAQVKKWNNLRTNSVPVGRRLTIYQAVPTKEKESTEVQLASNDSPVSGNTTTQSVTTTSYYKVKKGDTWSGIAKKNGVTIAEIKKWNNIKSNSLIAGKQLKIQQVKEVEVVVEETVKLPEPKLSVVALDSVYIVSLVDDYMKRIERDESSLPLIRIASLSDTPERKTGDDTKIIYHKVRIGETITQIATRYNVSKKDIVSWNRLSSNVAKVGQRLLIRLPEADQSDAVNKAEKGTESSGSLVSNR
ncbi:LysM peptidoglycan-binding domain-containing protein [Dysgonomonas sp. ZJ279]|uniref:LysM peptidoglycan-binding domain-containing protein n=1 Tax=Dysgonomonas sp. ZJ279 TaxID=2709796 RepID=UPI0013ECB1B0|nr:LysM peptidoglycan-binding domain-containing protein [Dysgonomonas sp. ZJ279]